VSFDLSVPARLQQPGFAADTAGFAQKINPKCPPWTSVLSSTSSLFAPRSGLQVSSFDQPSAPSDQQAVQPLVAASRCPPSTAVVQPLGPHFVPSVQSPPLFEDFRQLSPQAFNPFASAKMQVFWTARFFVPSPRPFHKTFASVFRGSSPSPRKRPFTPLKGFRRSKLSPSRTVPDSTLSPRHDFKTIASLHCSPSSLVVPFDLSHVPKSTSVVG
jgi:hypothetical protein